MRETTCLVGHSLLLAVLCDHGPPHSLWASLADVARGWDLVPFLSFRSSQGPWGHSEHVVFKCFLHWFKVICIELNRPLEKTGQLRNEDGLDTHTLVKSLTFVGWVEKAAEDRCPRSSINFGFIWWSIPQTAQQLTQALRAAWWDRRTEGWDGRVQVCPLCGPSQGLCEASWWHFQHACTLEGGEVQGQHPTALTGDCSSKGPDISLIFHVTQITE